MTANKFLNPILKAIVCSTGALIMGYLLVPQIMSGEPYDHLILTRGVVFLGFLYLLVQSVREILQRRGIL